MSQGKLGIEDLTLLSQYRLYSGSGPYFCYFHEVEITSPKPSCCQQPFPTLPGIYFLSLEKTFVGKEGETERMTERQTETERDKGT